MLADATLFSCGYHTLVGIHMYQASIPSSPRILFLYEILIALHTQYLFENDAQIFSLMLSTIVRCKKAKA